MSVKIFRGIGSSDLDNFNGTTGSAANTLYAVRAALKITVPIGENDGSRRSQTVEWDSQGTSIQNAINNAADVAQTIVDNSNGYITMFTLQLGLFRPDVEGTPMSAGELSYASIGLTNLKNASGEPVSAVRARSHNMYVPFAKETVTRAGIKSAFQALATAGKICQINFHDNTKESFDITPLTYVYGSTLKDYEAKGNMLLASDDTNAGISDGTLRKS